MPLVLGGGAIAGATVGSAAAPIVVGAAAGAAGAVVGYGVGYGVGAATGLVACEGGKAIDFLKDKLGHLPSPSTPAVPVANAKGKSS